MIKYQCRVHGEVGATYIITVYNDAGELVFRRVYCLQCYDRFLQNHLDPLVEVNEEDKEQEKYRL